MQVFIYTIYASYAYQPIMKISISMICSRNTVLVQKSKVESESEFAIYSYRFFYKSITTISVITQDFETKNNKCMPRKFMMKLIVKTNPLR